MTAPTIAALVDVAHDIVARRQFDAEVVLTLLSKLPGDELDIQTRGAIKHAQIVAVAAGNGGVGSTAIARFALARVVVLLEEHLEPPPITELTRSRNREAPRHSRIVLAIARVKRFHHGRSRP